jgi:hypothetical protein
VRSGRGAFSTPQEPRSSSQTFCAECGEDDVAQTTRPCLASVWVSENPGRRDERETLMATLRRSWFHARAVAFFAAVGLVSALVMASPASATTPGDNGRIAFKRYFDSDRSTGADLHDLA